MFFWNSLAFLVIQRMLTLWSLFLCLFQIQLEHLEVLGSCNVEPGLKNFEHYFASVWDECNCAVVWTFFGAAFLWDWNENWPFHWKENRPQESCGHCWVFQICWHIECSTFTASSFRIWNSSPGIPSPPLALFVVMLPKCNAGDIRDVGLIPGLGRSPGEGKGYPLQYSGLENYMNCIVHGVAKSWTWLSDFHFLSFTC